MMGILLGLAAAFIGPLARLQERLFPARKDAADGPRRLEHIGDIIDKNLAELAGNKIKRKSQFSSEGAEELAVCHKRIVDSQGSALGGIMSGDVKEAR